MATEQLDEFLGTKEQPAAEIIAELRQLLTERERRFADHGIDSMASYRRRRNAGEFGDDLGCVQCDRGAAQAPDP